MLRILAILFGIIFIIAGVLGFIPDFTPQGKLFGFFMVNPPHNIVHLATGIVALLCGLGSAVASKYFFIIFGLIYAAVAIWGFYSGEGLLLNLIALNAADNWLHAVVAVVCLYIGFSLRAK